MLFPVVSFQKNERFSGADVNECFCVPLPVTLLAICYRTTHQFESVSFEVLKKVSEERP